MHNLVLPKVVMVKRSMNVSPRRSLCFELKNSNHGVFSPNVEATPRLAAFSCLNLHIENDETRINHNHKDGDISLVLKPNYDRLAHAHYPSENTGFFYLAILCMFRFFIFPTHLCSACSRRPHVGADTF